MAKTGKAGTDPVEALRRSPSHLLHRALQLALDLYAEEAGSGAPTQRQYAVLSAVAAHEGLTQTDLVRATGIDRSTLADLVARMIGKGLLARERSAADARANAVHLSEAGRSALAAAAPRVAAADIRILAALPKGKRESFLTALDELARASGKALAKAEKSAAKSAPKAPKLDVAGEPAAGSDAKAGKDKPKAKSKKKKGAKAKKRLAGA
jgi:DNA-binding MarR family transcriptional regulator